MILLKANSGEVNRALLDKDPFILLISEAVDEI